MCISFHCVGCRTPLVKNLASFLWNLSPFLRETQGNRKRLLPPDPFLFLNYKYGSFSLNERRRHLCISVLPSLKGRTRS